MDLITKMNQTHFFSNSETAIIQFLLHNPEIIRNYTTKEIANQTYTSPSTVVRLAQKLGYQGYNDFRIDFLSAVHVRKSPLISIDANFPFKENDAIETISSNLSQLFIDAIQESNSLVDAKKYEQVIQLLDEADFIDIYGVGLNQHLAYSFMLDMKRINKEVTISENHQELVIKAANSNKRRVSLIISYTGETDEIIEYCQILKNTNSPMICISSVGHNSISDLCNITLNIVSREKMFSKISTFSSKVSILLILDLLYAGLFSKNYENNIEHSIEMKKISTPFRSKNKPLLEDI
ncbi:MurR/RpiR family transcriptional regulator [Carnobacterium sp. CS13]|uniref:MurR/RpiR family transcriptional regulator n=1 Tax=Carnobacterium sp. CS13 TaxID=2800128 RepID=UPI001913793A|nr:MurR/RpiR family transcriptional regulator [Carnobacterium sp. CS13]QQP70142.1 MurR/RpiR family transcriptional regulator [Carnobacterium sp. CS13]